MPKDQSADSMEKSIRRLTMAIWVVAFALIANFLLSAYPLAFPDKYIQRFSNATADNFRSEISIPDHESSEEGFTRFEKQFEKQFYELSPEEQIARASVIVLAEYEPSPDGKMKAILKEFLKRDEGITFYYDLDDEYPSSSYYPKEDTRYGNGLIIFFEGNPASMRQSLSYRGDRISSLGDMPLELFKSKCGESEDA